MTSNEIRLLCYALRDTLNYIPDGFISCLGGLLSIGLLSYQVNLILTIGFNYLINSHII